MRIEELNQLPIILIMYHSGSSGEFLAHALSQSLNTITHPEMLWEGESRCKVRDFFGRSLNGGSEVIDNNLVLERIELFFKSAIEIKKHHIGLSHPTPVCNIEFIKQYLPGIPIIEITVKHDLSKKFKFYAAKSKIPADVRKNVQKNFSLTTNWQSVYQSDRHLYIEWEDLILTDPTTIFEQIKQFLSIDGNTNTFLEMINDYKERNTDLLRHINEI